MSGKRVLGMFGMAVIAALGFAGSALAQPIVGVPHDWQMNFPPPYTPVMEKVESLNDLLLVIISLICVFVLGLLLYAMWRFHASRSPAATTTTHNTVLEIAWTVVPILILVIIAIPSFRLLYYADKAVDAAFTIKVTGNQWYWTYNYPGQCSQICGDNHSYMPIAVRVVSKDIFDKWVEQKKKAAGLGPATDVASVTA